MEILTLKESEIKSFLEIDDVIRVVENAFIAKAHGKVQMPPKPYLYFKKYDGDLRIMPAYLEDIDMAGVKIVNSHPNNPKYGLPTVMAVVVLNEPKTGMPLAILPATYITSLRTGAASAIATNYLSRKDSTIVGVVGAGAQAEAQLLGLCKVRKIKEVKVFDVVAEKMEEYASEMQRKLGINVEAVDNAKEVVSGVDILVTITPVKKPIVKDGWVGEGMHINAVGADAPGKQELEVGVLKRSKVVVDDWEQASHGGEINVPFTSGVLGKDNIYAELGQIVSGMKKGREDGDEITVFDSTGLAIQDISTAWFVYEEAKRRGIGTSISF